MKKTDRTTWQSCGRRVAVSTGQGRGVPVGKRAAPRSACLPTIIELAGMTMPAFGKPRTIPLGCGYEFGAVRWACSHVLPQLSGRIPDSAAAQRSQGTVSAVQPV